MNAAKELLTIIHSHPYFPELREIIINSRPVVPGYDPREDDQSTIEWKHKCALRDGYDLCLTILNINPEGE